VLPLGHSFATQGLADHATQSQRGESTGDWETLVMVVDESRAIEKLIGNELLFGY